jgi:hypothetical protein
MLESDLSPNYLMLVLNIFLGYNTILNFQLKINKNKLT